MSFYKSFRSAKNSDVINVLRNSSVLRRRSVTNLMEVPPWSRKLFYAVCSSMTEPALSEPGSGPRLDVVSENLRTEVDCWNAGTAGLSERYRIGYEVRYNSVLDRQPVQLLQCRSYVVRQA